MLLKGRATIGEKEEQAAGQCAPQIMLVPSVQKHMPTARAMALPEQVPCGSGAVCSADCADGGGAAKAVLCGTKGAAGEHVSTT